MQGMPDLYNNTTQNPSVAPQSLSASQTVNGAKVATADAESIVLELALGATTGSPTGGTVTLIPQESADGSTNWTQVNTSDSVVGNYNDTMPEVLRYRYTGGANGKLGFVRVVATAALTGGSSPTIPVSGNVLLGGLKYAGKQPTAGSYPQSAGGAPTN